MISIVTGTLNRRNLLPNLIKNTVDLNNKIELVLVDGGSTDGTIEFLEDLNHPRVKLVKIGHRSSYPHFMNTGIKNATHEIICQWNDDVLMLTNWDDVLEEIKDKEVDAWIFSWQYLNYNQITNKDCHDYLKWILHNQKSENENGEIVVNYGLYRKDLFRKFGLYDNKFHFYFADGELSHRFYSQGAVFKNCHNVRVASIEGVPKSAGSTEEHWNYYQECLKNHNMKKFQSNIEFL